MNKSQRMLDSTKRQSQQHINKGKVGRVSDHEILMIVSLIIVHVYELVLARLG